MTNCLPEEKGKAGPQAGKANTLHCFISQL